jgi:hypothetical protein
MLETKYRYKACGHEWNMKVQEKNRPPEIDRVTKRGGLGE